MASSLCICITSLNLSSFFCSEVRFFFPSPWLHAFSNARLAAFSLHFVDGKIENYSLYLRHTALKPVLHGGFFHGNFLSNLCFGIL